MLCFEISLGDTLYVPLISGVVVSVCYTYIKLLLTRSCYLNAMAASLASCIHIVYQKHNISISVKRRMDSYRFSSTLSDLYYPA